MKHLQVGAISTISALNIQSKPYPEPGYKIYDYSRLFEGGFTAVFTFHKHISIGGSLTFSNFSYAAYHGARSDTILLGSSTLIRSQVVTGTLIEVPVRMIIHSDLNKFFSGFVSIGISNEFTAMVDELNTYQDNRVRSTSLVKPYLIGLEGRAGVAINLTKINLSIQPSLSFQQYLSPLDKVMTKSPRRTSYSLSVYYRFGW